MKQLKYFRYGYEVMDYMEKQKEEFALILCNTKVDDAYLIHVGDDYQAIEETANNIVDAVRKLNESMLRPRMNKYFQVLDRRGAIYSSPLF